MGFRPLLLTSQAPAFLLYLPQWPFLPLVLRWPLLVCRSLTLAAWDLAASVVLSLCCCGLGWCLLGEGPLVTPLLLPGCLGLLFPLGQPWPGVGLPARDHGLGWVSMATLLRGGLCLWPVQLPTLKLSPVTIPRDGLHLTCRRSLFELG